MTEIALTIPSLQAAYAAGMPVARVIAQVYERIAQVGDPAIFITLIPQDQVLAAAEALGPYDPALPLWGVPFAVKDNIDVAGCPTTAACPAFAYKPTTDAFVVARLKAAGALCIGKTNLDQFATGLVGVRSPYGVPLNALDPAIVPGGIQRRVGGGGGAGHRDAGPWHRYRRVGPRACGAEQHCRAETQSGRVVCDRGRSGLPQHRDGVDLRADGAGCLAGLSGRLRL